MSVPVHSVPYRSTLYAQTRIDHEVQHVDHQVDDDEDQRDQAQVRCHHRNVGELHRLDEQQPHTRPLEHRLGDDGEGDQAAELQTHDRHHRDQGVLQRMAEIHAAVGQTACPCELDVVGAQHLEHLRTHQP